MISLLGPVGLLCGDRQIRPESAQKATLLAILALQPGQPVPTEQIIDRMWVDGPPDQARETVSRYASSLRGTFEQAGMDRNVLEYRDRGLVLDVDPLSVDYHRCRDLVRKARLARNDEDSPSAVELLSQADRLWRGAPLADLNGDWAIRKRESLESWRLDVALMRFEVMFGMGCHSDVLDELRHLAAEHPTDERIAKYVLVGLTATGNFAGADRFYDQWHPRYVERTDAEVGDDLRALRVQIAHRRVGPPASTAQMEDAVVKKPRTNDETEDRREDLTSGSGNHFYAETKVVGHVVAGDLWITDGGRHGPDEPARDTSQS